MSQRLLAAVLALSSFAACQGRSAGPDARTGADSTGASLGGGTLTDQALGLALAASADAEDHRRSADPALILQLQTLADERALIPAIRAAGRIADVGYVQYILPQLSDTRANVRAAAALALQLVGDRKSAAPALQSTLASALASTAAATADEVRAYVRALGVLHEDGARPTLETLLLSEQRPGVLEGAAFAWGNLLDTLDAQATPNPAVLQALLTCATHGEARETMQCASALLAAAHHWKSVNPWLPADALTAAIKAGEHDSAVGYLYYVLRRYPRASAEATLRAEATNRARASFARGFALTALDAGGFSNADDFAAALRDASPALRVTALDLLSSHAPSAVDAAMLTRVRAIYDHDTSPWARGEALKVLALFAPDSARPIVMAAMQSQDRLAELAAYASLAEMATAADVQALAQETLSMDVRRADPAATALATLSADKIPAAATDALRTTVTTILAQARTYQTTGMVAAAATLIGVMRWNDLAPTLVDLYTYFASPACQETIGMEARKSILLALAALDDKDAAALVESALIDPEHVVGVQAAATYQTLTGQDASAKVPLNSRVDDVTPTGAVMIAAQDTHVVLRLQKGDIILHMLPDAPLTAAKFVALAEAGLYDGSEFHRVVPGFVAQGGDPSNTGDGVGAKFMRDELSAYGHARGTVGIATDGHDTGETEFFINLVDNLYLDANYTVFAEVDAGMDVADRIEAGDAVLHAFVVQGSGAGAGTQ